MLLANSGQKKEWMTADHSYADTGFHTAVVSLYEFAMLLMMVLCRLGGCIPYTLIVANYLQGCHGRKRIEKLYRSNLKIKSKFFVDSGYFWKLRIDLHRLKW